MDDDVDIYGDLPHFDVNECSECKKKIRELAAAKTNWEQEKCREDSEWKLKYEKEKNEKEMVLKNSSSLMKTARAEIDRKDRIIMDLRRELEDLKFRRTGYNRSKKRSVEPKKNQIRQEIVKDTTQVPIAGINTLPPLNQPGLINFLENEEEDPEQIWEPDQDTFTVYGERLRRKIAMEDEAERLQKEEAKAALSNSESTRVKVEQAENLEIENLSHVVKLESGKEKRLEDLKEKAPICKLETAISESGSLHSSENDEKSLHDHKNVYDNFNEKIVEAFENETNRPDDDSHYKPHFNHEPSYKFDESRRKFNRLSRHPSNDHSSHGSHEYSRYPRDRSRNSDYERKSRKIEIFDRNRQTYGKRSRSDYRSRSKSRDLRREEKRSVKQRWDSYRNYDERCDKRRDDGLIRDKYNYTEWNNKDFHDLRERLVDRNEDKIGGRNDDDNYKNYRVDSKRTAKSRSPSTKSRSSSRGRVRGREIDKRKSRRSRSRERIDDADIKMVLDNEHDEKKRGLRNRKIASERNDRDFGSFSKISVREMTNNELHDEAKNHEQSRRNSVKEETGRKIQNDGVKNVGTSRRNSSKEDMRHDFRDFGSSGKNSAREMTNNELPDEPKNHEKSKRNSVKEETGRKIQNDGVKNDGTSRRNSSKEEMRHDFRDFGSSGKNSAREMTNNEFPDEPKNHEKSRGNSVKEETGRKIQNDGVKNDGTSRRNSSKEEMRHDFRDFGSSGKNSARELTNNEFPDEPKNHEKSRRNSVKEETGRKIQNDGVKNDGTSRRNSSKEETRTVLRDDGTSRKNSLKDSTKNKVSDEPKNLEKARINSDKDLTSREFPGELKNLGKLQGNSAEVSTNRECSSSEQKVPNLTRKMSEIHQTKIEEPNENSVAVVESRENLLSPSEAKEKFIFMLENDSGSPLIPLTRQDVVPIGSRSFREEKIENIEKFIQDFQYNENHCVLLGNDDFKEPNGENKSRLSTSSIVAALSMDFEDENVENSKEAKGELKSVRNDSTCLPSLDSKDKAVDKKLTNLAVDKKLKDNAINKMTKEGVLDKKSKDAANDKNSIDTAMDKKTKEGALDKKSKGVAIDEKSKDVAINDKSKDVVIDNKSKDVAINDKSKDVVIDNKSKDIAINDKSKDVMTDKKSKDLTIDEKSKDVTVEKPCKKVVVRKSKDIAGDNKSKDVSNKKLDDVIDMKSENLPVGKKLENLSVGKKSKDKIVDKKSENSIVDKKSEDTIVDKKSGNSIVDKKSEDTIVDKKSGNSIVDKKSEDTIVDKKSKVDPIDKKSKLDPIDKKSKVDPIDKKSKVDTIDKKSKSDTIDKKLKLDTIDKKSKVDSIDKKSEDIVIDAKSADISVDSKSEDVPIDKKSKNVPILEKPEKKFIPPLPPSPQISSLPPLPPSPLPPSPPTKEEKLPISEIPVVQEICPSEPYNEKPQMKKGIAKQIKKRPRIPCIPIVSRYSRQRHVMVLADYVASKTMIMSDSIGNTTVIEKEKEKQKIPQIPEVELKFPSKPTKSSNLTEIEPDNSTNEPVPETEKKIAPENLVKADDTAGKNLKKMSQIVSENSNSLVNANEPEVNVSSNILMSTGDKKFEEELKTVSAASEKNNVPENEPEEAEIIEESKPEVEAKGVAQTLKNSEKISKTNKCTSSERETCLALKILASAVPSSESGSSNRKRILPREKENQSKSAKQPKIMVIAKRRKPVQLHDSSSASTLVSSAHDRKNEETAVKIIPVKIEVRGRKLRSANK